MHQLAIWKRKKICTWHCILWLTLYKKAFFLLWLKIQKLQATMLRTERVEFRVQKILLRLKFSRNYFQWCTAVSFLNNLILSKILDFLVSDRAPFRSLEFYHKNNWEWIPTDYIFCKVFCFYIYCLWISTPEALSTNFCITDSTQYSTNNI